MTNNAACRRDAGFTLIEVLVAFAILSVCIGSLFLIFQTSLHRGEAAAAERSATAAAQALLATVGTDIPLVDGERSGTLPPGLRWQVVIRPYGDPDPQRLLPMVPHAVSVTVWWGGSHSITLDSLRLEARS
jgi:general secretion pathway protein I